MPRDLKTKAQQLLARRDSPMGIWFYIHRDWPRQLLFVAGYIAVSLALWTIHQHILAAAFASFFVGRTIRDIRWWRALSQEWPTTAEFVDWQKVEEIATN